MSQTKDSKPSSSAPESDESELKRLYEDFAGADLIPLWTQRADLMPLAPQPQARPAVWRWSLVSPLAERAGQLVPVGQGGERRAIALANPGLGGHPYTTPTLWSAIQYLGPREVASSHRHSQGAFRFMLQGRSVWTTVDGDPLELRAGDLILTPAWAWHEHRSLSDEAAVWLDGLDIPLVQRLDAGFFQVGSPTPTNFEARSFSRSERLWSHPGLRPIGDRTETPDSPLLAYRREHIDAALSDQIGLQGVGDRLELEAGHAAVRMISPATGGDALPTMRLEMHRLLAGGTASWERSVGSSVWQVFDGVAAVDLGDERHDVGHGDIFAVPAWCPVRIHAHEDTDFFVFSDAPVYEKLSLDGRTSGDVKKFMSET